MPGSPSTATLIVKIRYARVWRVMHLVAGGM
jgi:hypothetical protein